MFQQVVGGPVEPTLYTVTPSGRRWTNSLEAGRDTLSRNIINSIETDGPMSIFELESVFGNTVEFGEVERSVSKLLRSNFIKRSRLP